MKFILMSDDTYIFSARFAPVDLVNKSLVYSPYSMRSQCTRLSSIHIYRLRLMQITVRLAADIRHLHVMLLVSIFALYMSIHDKLMLSVCSFCVLLD